MLTFTSRQRGQSTSLVLEPLGSGPGAHPFSRPSFLKAQDESSRMLSRTLRKGGSTGAHHEASVGITSVIATTPKTITHRTTLMPSCSYAEFRLRTHNCTQSTRGWSIRHSLRISVLVLGLRSGRHHRRTARL